MIDNSRKRETGRGIALTAAVTSVGILASGGVYLLMDPAFGILAASLTGFSIWMSWAFTQLPRRKLVAAGWLLAMSGIIGALANFVIQDRKSTRLNSSHVK